MATKNLAAKIQMRRDTEANWESINPILAAGEIGYDTTNRRTKIGDGVTVWKELTSFMTMSFDFATASWKEIAEIAAAGTASKYFRVGDKKTISLLTGELVTLIILGFGHDDLTAGGKAPITLGMENLLATTYCMNSPATNVGGWNASQMRTSTMATLLTQLPVDLQAVIKQSNKKTSSGSSTITTSVDNLFLFSEVEIANAITQSYAGEGEQYEYWRTVKDGTVAKNRIKKLSNGSGSAVYWWLRSPRKSSSDGFACYMDNGLDVNSGSNRTYGISFGFCI